MTSKPPDGSDSEESNNSEAGSWGEGFEGGKALQLACGKSSQRKAEEENRESIFRKKEPNCQMAGSEKWKGKTEEENGRRKARTLII